MKAGIRKKLIIAMLMLMLVSLITGGVTYAFAESAAGLELTVNTDKESYTSGEAISVSVDVKNTGTVDATDIKGVITLPDSLTATGSKEFSYTTLAAGKSEAYSLTLTGNTGEGNSDNNDDNPGGNSENKNDKKFSGTALAVIIASAVLFIAAAAVIAVLIIRKNKNGKNNITALSILCILMTAAMLLPSLPLGALAAEESTGESVEASKNISVDGVSCEVKVKVTYKTDGSSGDDGSNTLLFENEKEQVMVELCTSRTVRVQLSTDGDNGYREENPEYYMVQKTEWEHVDKTVTDMGDYTSIKTNDIEIRVQKSPIRIGMYDLSGNLISKDTDTTGMYTKTDGTRGVRKVESTVNAGGIFGFGSGDHGRRSELNRYGSDFTEFTMSHGRLIAPFFMSTVGYGMFLNTIEKDTTFFKNGGGFETKGYLDYFFMYGPDFKTILNEYAEITGRMEMYGKWAQGFMLSKYGNDNATQAEVIQWMEKLRSEGYPCDCYVFDYGWRGDVADNGGNKTGAGEKFGKQMWSNDKTKFPNIAQMFEKIEELGFHVGLHNNAGTPEASGGATLYIQSNLNRWVKSYMDSVITTGYGDFFWPDEFDVLGSNTAPVLSSKGAYEAWQEFTDRSRPMFMTRGSYAGQHFATAWSGDISNNSQELLYQIGYSIDAGLVGYWAVSHDLGGFMSRPTDALYTRWVSEFGAWCGIMRTHGHDGREPWTYNTTAQDTLKENLKIRYSLYPYMYSLQWQGYSAGTPIMRAMILEDDSRNNPDAWSLNEQYYYGDWFLVAPAADTADTIVSVWFPPNTTWYNYYTGERYEGGANGKTVNVFAALDEIPVFVKAGAIVPMGPDVNYADELPLDPLTLDIYPKGSTSFTLYEDDGESRKYITENAYSTTKFDCTLSGGTVTFVINERVNGNAAVYKPDSRSYNLKFNHITSVSSAEINGRTINAVKTLAAYNSAAEAYYIDAENDIVYVKTPDTGLKMTVVLKTGGIVEPAEGKDNEGVPLPEVSNGTVYELENAKMTAVAGGQVIANNEWKGYTGDGFAKGFKGNGDSLEFTVDVKEAGVYSLVLRVNCGKKNSAQYDSSPREGTLYLGSRKLKDFKFEVTSVWGNTVNNVKQGVWIDYTVENVVLEAGSNTFKFVAEGSTNPGNYNLDSLTFRLTDNTVNAFGTIEAESAGKLVGAVVTEIAGASGGKAVKVTSNGGYLRFDSVEGSGKSSVSLRVKCAAGCKITVYENGVGDKVLATLTVPANADWQTVELACRDTDAAKSGIFLEFNGNGAAVDCLIDSFTFKK